MQINTLKDLQLYMDSECFNDYTYSIGKKPTNLFEGNVLNFDGQKYVYYYTERGKKRIIKEFTSKLDACRFVFEELRNSKTGRQHCIGLTKTKLKIEELCNLLNERSIKYEMDSIPYSGKNDLWYRIFIFGRDILKAKDLEKEYREK